MPRKASYNTESAKAYLFKIGYEVPNDFKYINKNTKIKLYDLVNEKYISLSMNQIEYRTKCAITKRPEFKPIELNNILDIDFQPGRVAIDKATRREMYNIINDVQAQPGPTQDEDRVFKNNLASLTFINQSVPSYRVDDLKLHIKQQLPSIVKDIKTALKQDSTAIIDVLNKYDDEDATKQAVLIAIQILKKEILRKNVNVYIQSADGSQKRFYLNKNSIDLLNEALFQDNIPDVNDSNTEILSSYYIKNIMTISFEVSPRVRPNRSAPGFFSFINKSDIDLTQFGIYSTAQDPMLFKESCLITAIKNSGILVEDELKRLQHFVNTRTYLHEELPNICNEFIVNIVLHMFSERTQKVNMREYKSPTPTDKTIKLAVMFGHYMVDKKPEFTPTKELKKGITIFTLINKLINLKLLVPMSDDDMINIMASFVKNDPINYNFKRLVEVKPPKPKNPNSNYISKAKHTKFFFGYEPKPDEIDLRINEIQSFVNKLPLHKPIDVKQYYRYSNLMQRIMYEFGCYDNVYKSSG